MSHFLLLLGYIEVFISYRAKYQYNFFFHLWLLKKEVLFHPNMFSTSYALIFLNVYIYLFGCAGSQLQLGPVGSSSLTRGPTCAPRAGTVGSKPLDHQGMIFFFFFFFEAYLMTWQPTPVYLAWKIPWMEERGRLHSMGSQSQTQLSDFSFSLTTFILEIEKELLLW